MSLKFNQIDQWDNKKKTKNNQNVLLKLIVNIDYTIPDYNSGATDSNTALLQLTLELFLRTGG